MSLVPDSAPTIPTHWPGIVVIVRPVGPGFVLRLTG